MSKYVVVYVVAGSLSYSRVYDTYTEAQEFIKGGMDEGPIRRAVIVKADSFNFGEESSDLEMAVLDGEW